MQQIIIETLKRFVSKNPKYFVKLQIACAVLTALCLGAIGAEKWFPELVPDSVSKMASDIWGYVAILIAAFQLPKDDQPTA